MYGGGLRTSVRGSVYLWHCQRASQPTKQQVCRIGVHDLSLIFTHYSFFFLRIPSGKTGKSNNEVHTDEEDMTASQPAMAKWKTWSVDQVATRLFEEDFPESVVQKFRDHKIDGQVLQNITDDQMNTLGIMELGLQNRFKNFQKQLVLEGSKVFNDPIHGLLEFHPLCVAIIDTPQFQRLRHLKQLGVCYYVYPGASHNRFEHCLGVCHLAGQLVTALRDRQPGLGISDKDVLCVQIAGLCHDLGHGPFSHVFDKIINPNMKKKEKNDWKHEQASIEMFDYLVQTNELQSDFEDCGIFEKERTFIKELIIGEGLTKDKDGKIRKHYESDTKKGFLYEIVANQRNGVDVDKWDYFARDCHHLGISTSFDHTRFIKFSRVISVDGELQICVRDKEAYNMYEMFHTRLALHRRAYQHKVVHAAEIMIIEAMKEAEDSGCVKIPGDDGKECSISECTEHMDAFTNLTDDILQLIKMTRAPKGQTNNHLTRAHEILRKFDRRKFYKCVGESGPITDTCIDDVKAEILKELSKEEVEHLELDKASRFVVQVAKLDFWGKEKNPLDNLRFFTKDNQNKAVSVKASEISCMLPHELFKEQLVRLYLCPSGDDEADAARLEALKVGFMKWCHEKKLPEPKVVAWICRTPRQSKDPHSDGFNTPDRPTKVEKATTPQKPRKRPPQENEESDRPKRTKKAVSAMKF